MLTRQDCKSIGPTSVERTCRLKGNGGQVSIDRSYLFLEIGQALTRGPIFREHTFTTGRTKEFHKRWQEGAMCTDGGTATYYQNTAEGLLLQAFGPLIASANDCSPKLQRVLESACGLGLPGVAEVRNNLFTPFLTKGRVRIQCLHPSCCSAYPCMASKFRRCMKSLVTLCASGQSTTCHLLNCGLSHGFSWIQTWPHAQLMLKRVPASKIANSKLNG